MVPDIDPQVIGITESWANKDIVDAELALTGYVMFRKDRQERRGWSRFTCIKESIQADCEEAIWCNIVAKNINNRRSFSQSKRGGRFKT